MRYLFALLWLWPGLVLAECPALSERSERQDELMSLVAKAPDEAQAQKLNNELWQIWTTAPDAISQEMLNRGMQRRGSYDFIGAISDFDAVIAYCPDYAEGYNQRAFVHFLSGDFPASLADLDRALAIMPDHIGAVSGKALVLLAMGETRLGQIVLREALALNPWLPERHQLQPLDDLSKEGLEREL